MVMLVVLKLSHFRYKIYSNVLYLKMWYSVVMKNYEKKIFYDQLFINMGIK